MIVLRRRRNSLMKQYRGELEPAVLAQNGRTGAMICQNGDDVLQSISMRKWIGLGRYSNPFSITGALSMVFITERMVFSSEH